jgi:putative ABC transport system permease protein
MKYLRLVRVNLLRRKGRTILTVLSVAVAMFLFTALRSVLTTLAASGQVGSESRLVTRNAIGITFPLPEAYANRLAGVDGVRAVTWANWFGGQYVKPQNFFVQFAVDAKSYFPMFPEWQIPPDQLAAFMQERTAAVAGKGLMERFGWRLGQTITLQGTIFPGDWDFTIRAVYTPSNPSAGDQNFFFHYDYLLERTERQVTPGWFQLLLADPAQAPAVSQRIDDLFRNSTAPTKTETERAFQAGFVTMWGNVAFLVRAIGTAVFFAILLVAANTMMMAARERVNEVAVLKTLGFGDGLLATLVLVEAATVTLVGGGLGILGAKLLFASTSVISRTLPGFTVTWGTVGLGLGIAAALGLVSGAVPAWQAGRLSVIEALRHVA